VKLDSLSWYISRDLTHFVCLYSLLPQTEVYIRRTVAIDRQHAWCYHNCSSFSFETECKINKRCIVFSQGNIVQIILLIECIFYIQLPGFLHVSVLPLVLWLNSLSLHYPFISCIFLYLPVCLSSFFPFPQCLSSFFSLSFPLSVYVFISLSLFLFSFPLFPFSRIYKSLHLY
jgi:hypothetical protein